MSGRGCCASKLLFLSVYLYLPLMLAQVCMLLSAAGLDSPSIVPGLLFNLLLITGFVVLPLVAMAVVTQNLVAMVFAVLGSVALALGALIALTLHGYSRRDTTARYRAALFRWRWIISLRPLHIPSLRLATTSSF